MRLHRIVLPVFLLIFAPQANARLVDIITYNAPSPPPLQMVASNPGANSQLSESPKKIIVTFTQNILPEKSAIKLYDQYNALVNTIPIVTQSATNTLAVDVPGKLMSGTYRVEWNVQCLCTQGIAMNNVFYFSVY